MTAIKASLHSYKSLATRPELQITFQVPKEYAAEALEMLGLPDPSGTQWFAIARLVAEIGPDLKAEKSADKPVTPSASGEGQDIRRTYTRSQMAAILCRDPDFMAWVYVHNDAGIDPSHFEKPRDCVAAILKHKLQIVSRSELDTNPSKAEAWDKLYNSFKYRDQVR